MGKSADSLPDPTKPPAITASGDTDELLAQMAGDEIDRLLAEADVEKPPIMKMEDEADVQRPAESEMAKFRAAASLESELIPEDSQTQKQLDALFDEINNSTPADFQTPAVEKLVAAGPLPEPAPVAETPSAEVQPEPSLNQVLSDAVAQKEPPVQPEVAQPTALMEPVSQTESESLDPAERTGALERKVLEECLKDVANAEALAGEEQPARPAADRGVSWILTPLEWLNAPIEFMSDAARELMGKVAIVTLVNAMALLVYVLIFRRGN